MIKPKTKTNITSTNKNKKFFHQTPSSKQTSTKNKESNKKEVNYKKGYLDSQGIEKKEEKKGKFIDFSNTTALLNSVFKSKSSSLADKFLTYNTNILNTNPTTEQRDFEMSNNKLFYTDHTTSSPSNIMLTNQALSTNIYTDNQTVVTSPNSQNQRNLLIDKEISVSNIDRNDTNLRKTNSSNNYIQIPNNTTNRSTSQIQYGKKESNKSLRIVNNINTNENISTTQSQVLKGNITHNENRSVTNSVCRPKGQFYNRLLNQIKDSRENPSIMNISNITSREEQSKYDCTTGNTQ